MGAVPHLGLCVVGGIGIQIIVAVCFFYTITKWSHKNDGQTAPTLLANISQMELNETNSV